MLTALLAPARAATRCGLLSDAGCPGVADPGASLVAAAHAAEVARRAAGRAVVAAARADGLGDERAELRLPRLSARGRQPNAPTALRRLEDESRTLRRAQLFIETPYRNEAMLKAIGDVLRATTTVCVAADLTLPTQTVERRTAGQWAREETARFAKRPAIFIVEA